MRRRLMISLLLFWVGFPTGTRAEDIQQNTLLLQRIQFAGGVGHPAGASDIPFTIASPVLHTSFRTSSYALPATFTRLKDLVPDSEHPRMRSLIAASSWLKGQFMTEGEVANNSSHELPAVSRIDRREDSSNRMVRFALTGSNSQVRYGLNYRSAGRAFFNSPDQTVREMWGEVTWGAAKLRSTMGEMWNNVDLDPTQARIEQRYGRIGLVVGKSSWPELSLTYARGATNSIFEPAGLIPQRLQSNSVEGALAYSGLTWHARLASSYIVTTDGLRNGAESRAFAQNFSGLFRPFNTLTIMPLFGYRSEHQQWSGARLETPMVSVSLLYKQSQRLLISAMGGYTSSRSADRLIDTESIVSRGMFAFHLDPIYGRSAMLSLEAAYNNTTNRVTPILNTEDISGLVRILIASL
ncbi:MAG: hypothetical protein ABW047_06390 [Nitrospiraceae bacterium]